MNSIIKYGALAVSIIMVTGALVVPMTVGYNTASALTSGGNGGTAATPATAVTRLRQRNSWQRWKW